MPVTRPLVLSLAWHGGRGNPFPHARAIQRTCLPHHRGQQRRPRSPSEYSGALAAREMFTPQLLFVAYRPQLFHGQWIKLLNHGNKRKGSSLPGACPAAYPRFPRRQACVLTTQIAGDTRHFAFPSSPFGYVLVGNGISHFLVVPIFFLSLFSPCCLEKCAW